MRYFIVDDDTASRRMLAKIIEEDHLGLVIGEAKNGKESLPLILAIHPDIVLIDLLMPELDGIETMEQLKTQGFNGQFIMISQIVNKEMVGEAYEKGVEFFIHKPINRFEVRSILKKTAEQFQLKHSLIAIRESLAHIESSTPLKKQRSIKEIVLSLLNDMGIAGESGSKDIVAMMEFLIHQNNTSTMLPPLKELYEAAANANTSGPVNIKKESKSIEQRIRRAIIAALNNLASLGTIDYTNPKFEYYAPRFFEFQEVRLRMRELEADVDEPMKVKINIKKFLQALYLETTEKFFHG
ncbi:response regulator [Pseudobacillus wudalianchiensis]|uniref:Histidine kinase n=1 Tax=Pseudobacillus wudalianchiensis TaxID=1743143 RepID=A0A1B9AGI7_9BACI|nr:response regulator [Bacillus wudalianchiensis]OCA82953.1 histidine kinase [Bacillus wudalianchiensis]